MKNIKCTTSTKNIQSEVDYTFLWGDLAFYFDVKGSNNPTALKPCIERTFVKEVCSLIYIMVDKIDKVVFQELVKVRHISESLLKL